MSNTTSSLHLLLTDLFGNSSDQDFRVTGKLPVDATEEQDFVILKVADNLPLIVYDKSMNNCPGNVLSLFAADVKSYVPFSLICTQASRALGVPAFAMYTHVLANGSRLSPFPSFSFNLNAFNQRSSWIHLISRIYGDT